METASEPLYLYVYMQFDLIDLENDSKRPSKKMVKGCNPSTQPASL